MSPPPYEAVLSGDDRWLADLGEPGGPWVLPELERCFLRHAAGLSLVRKVLERAASGHLAAGLIGCDSWAWAYLQRAAADPRAPVRFRPVFGDAYASPSRGTSTPTTGEAVPTG